MEILRDEMEEITLVNPRESENAHPLEEVTLVSIHLNHPNCHIMIGTELTKELRIALVKFLKENYHIFAWSQGDVPGINLQVNTNRLFTNPDYPPVCRKEGSLPLIDWKS